MDENKEILPERDFAIESEIRRIVEAHPAGTWPRIILAKNNKRLLDYINARTPKLQDPQYLLSTKIYWTLNGLEDFPLCQNEKCQKPLIGKNAHVINGYTRPFCNMSCSRGSAKAIEKNRQTCLERYGDPNYRNREKAVQTNFERYGAKDIMQTTLGKERLSKTIEEKYGTQWFTQSETFKENAQKTWLEKYGVDNPTKSEAILEKIKKNNFEKYGVTNPMKLPEILERLKETIRRKYGCEWITQTDLFKEKSKKTCLEKYGFEWATQNPKIQDKIRQKFILNLPKFLKKIHKKYQFSGNTFDSSWELAYFIWLIDHNIEFVYQPNCLLEYLVDGITHHYFPDFLVEGKMVEIKGDHFFDEDGKMRNPWKKSKWTKEQKLLNDKIYEAKHQCMIANDVKILRNEDIQSYLKYVEEKYGKDFLQKCRKQYD